MRVAGGSLPAGPRAATTTESPVRTSAMAPALSRGSPSGSASATVVAVVAGAVAWAVFAMWLHGWWIGVRPFG